MAKQTKDSQPVSIRMDKKLFDRLNAYCEMSGQSKTVAIERALEMYIDDYDSKQAQLKKISKTRIRYTE